MLKVKYGFSTWRIPVNGPSPDRDFATHIHKSLQADWQWLLEICTGCIPGILTSSAYSLINTSTCFIDWEVAPNAIFQFQQKTGWATTFHRQSRSHWEVSVINLENLWIWWKLTSTTYYGRCASESALKFSITSERSKTLCEFAWLSSRLE